MLVLVFLVFQSCELPPEAMSRIWTSSYEEDYDNFEVFRPTGYKFPPSRGRRGFKLQPNGVYVAFGPGRDDAGSEISGTWKLLKKTCIIEATVKEETVNTTCFQIIEASETRLVLLRKSK